MGIDPNIRVEASKAKALADKDKEFKLETLSAKTEENALKREDIELRREEAKTLAAEKLVNKQKTSLGNLLIKAQNERDDDLAKAEILGDDEAKIAILAAYDNKVETMRKMAESVGLDASDILPEKKGGAGTKTATKEDVEAAAKKAGVSETQMKRKLETIGYSFFY